MNDQRWFLLARCLAFIIEWMTRDDGRSNVEQAELLRQLKEENGGFQCRS